MKFKYYTEGKPNEILGFPYLQHETLYFCEKDSVWKKTKSRIESGEIIHDIVNVEKERRIINANNYNFYDYEVNVDILLKSPIKAYCLRNFIIAKTATDNYRLYIGRVGRLSGIDNEEFLSITKLDCFGGLDLNLELGILFPDLLESLVIRNEKKNLEETFRFIIFDHLDINEMLKAELKEYNAIMNRKMKEIT